MGRSIPGLMFLAVGFVNLFLSLKIWWSLSTELSIYKSNYFFWLMQCVELFCSFVLLGMAVVFIIQKLISQLFVYLSPNMNVPKMIYIEFDKLNTF